MKASIMFMRGFHFCSGRRLATFKHSSAFTADRKVCIQKHVTLVQCFLLTNPAVAIIADCDAKIMTAASCLRRLIPFRGSFGTVTHSDFRLLQILNNDQRLQCRHPAVVSLRKCTLHWHCSRLLREVNQQDADAKASHGLGNLHGQLGRPFSTPRDLWSLCINSSAFQALQKSGVL
jgi:hypothetical protein